MPASGTGTLAISGTPTASGTETFTVTATDPSGATDATNYSIVISDQYFVGRPSQAVLQPVPLSTNASRGTDPCEAFP